MCAAGRGRGRVWHARLTRGSTAASRLLGRSVSRETSPAAGFTNRDLPGALPRCRRLGRRRVHARGRSAGDPRRRRSARPADRRAAAARGLDRLRRAPRRHRDRGQPSRRSRATSHARRATSHARRATSHGRRAAARAHGARPTSGMPAPLRIGRDRACRPASGTFVLLRIDGRPSIARVRGGSVYSAGRPRGPTGSLRRPRAN